MSLFLIPYLPFFIYYYFFLVPWSQRPALTFRDEDVVFYFFYPWICNFFRESPGRRFDNDISRETGGYYLYNSAVYSARLNQLRSLIVPKKPRCRQVNWVYIKKQISHLRGEIAHTAQSRQGMCLYRAGCLKETYRQTDNNQGYIYLHPGLAAQQQPPYVYYSLPGCLLGSWTPIFSISKLEIKSKKRGMGFSILLFINYLLFILVRSLPVVVIFGWDMCVCFYLLPWYINGRCLWYRCFYLFECLRCLFWLDRIYSLFFLIRLNGESLTEIRSTLIIIENCYRNPRIG